MLRLEQKLKEQAEVLANREAMIERLNADHATSKGHVSFRSFGSAMSV
jgi:hypothetical protein